MKLLLSASLMIAAFSADAVATAGEPASEIRGEVLSTVKTESIGPFLSAAAKRELDTLVPKLRQAAKDKIVKIEAQSYGITRNEAIYSSYYLAKEVELYLTQTHNLQLDFNISASAAPQAPDKAQQVTIVLYPNAFDAVKVKPR